MRLNLLRNILLGVCVCCVAAFLYTGIASVTFPHDLDDNEGVVIQPALQIASGQAIYGQRLVLSEPYSYAAYGPLYYVILGALLKLTGLAFWPGRLLSLLATVATTLLIYAVVNKRQKTAAPGFVAATLFIMTPAAWTFGFLQRVDALGIFFTTLCVALALSASEKRRNYLLAGGVAALAFLVKPTLIAAGLAVLVCLIIARAFKELGAFILGGAIVLAVAVMALLVTGNAGYGFTQWTNSHTPFVLQQFLIITRNLIQSQVVIALLALGGLWLFQTDLRNRQVANLLPIVYLVIAGGLGLLTCGRLGSAINYFYEFFVALALCAGLMVDKLASARDRAYPLAALLLLLALATGLAWEANYFIKDRLFAAFSKARLHDKIIQDLIQYVPAGEPVAGHYPDLVLRSGRPHYFNDIAIYLLGPDEVRAQLASYVAEKKLAAYVAMQEETIPGYRLVQEPGIEPSASVGAYTRGPLLYLRDDLWQKKVAVASRAP